MGGNLDARSPGQLRRSAVLFSIGAALFLAAGHFFISSWIPNPGARYWAPAVLAAWAYFSFLLWRHLDRNRSPDGRLYPSLGPANLLTLARAVLMSAFIGFLAVPRPEGAAGWLPGLLYLAAALPDYVDGIVARRTGRSTGLGEILDMNVDSAGVLAASTLAVLYGIVPAWYLPIGLARYLFVIGLRLRERLGLPVHELPPSIRRRGFAALKMGFMFVVLFPPFRPPGTHLAAAAFGLPFAVGFLWDWGLATGAIRPGTASRDSRMVRLVVDWLPVLLRAAVIPLGWVVLRQHLTAPGLAGLAAVEILALSLVVLGVAVHGAAILAAGLLGIAQNTVPFGLPADLLVVAVIGLIFLGAGRFALLPVDERLVSRRIGDPH